MKRLFLFIVYVLFSFSMLSAQQSGIIDEELFDLVAAAVSGENALEHVRKIAANHRVQATEGYDDAAQYVIEQLKNAGIEDVKLHKYRSDGKTRYNAYTSPLSWTVREAELKMVQPNEERLALYSEIPTSLTTLSNGGKWKGELIHLGEGISDSDYDGVYVKDKIVFASGYAGKVHRQAVIKRGAHGVVIYPVEGDRPQMRDAVRYNGLWPTWDERRKVGFGFQVSRVQSERLLELLEKGEKVVLEADVDAKLHRGNLEVVSAVIPGRDKKSGQFLLIAHLDHYKPGANDNASGSAALIEIANAVNRLIQTGKAERPRRSIRFLWVPEHFGTMAYLTKDADELEGSVAALNLDMVGENTALTFSRLNVIKTPASMPSFINDLFVEVVRYMENKDIYAPTGSRNLFDYEINAFTTGSDHDMLNDAMVGVPAVALGFWADPYHHTNEDSEDRVDPTSLKRCMAMAAYTALWVADAGRSAADKLIELTFARGRERIIDIGLAGAISSKSSNASDLVLEKVSQLDLQIEVEKGNLLTIRMLSQSDDVSVDLFTVAIEELAKSEQTLLMSRLGRSANEPEELITGSAARIPRRLFKGPVSDSYADIWFSTTLGSDYNWYKEPPVSNFKLIRYETVNFMDGVRSIAGIHKMVDAEYGPVGLEVVEKIIDDLVRLKLVEYIDL